MPAVPTPSRRRPPSRSIVFSGAVAASAGLALLTSGPAAADTARLVGVPESTFADGGRLSSDVTEAAEGDESDAAPAPKASRDARIVLTAADGRERRLGPFRLPAPVYAVTASPDGGHLILSTATADEDDFEFGFYALPVAGGTPKRLALPDGFFPALFSVPSFTADGAEMLFGDAPVIDPTANPDRLKANDVTYGSYRCALATGACTAFPAGTGGAVVGFPGGVLTASSLFSALADNAASDPTTARAMESDGWLPRDGRAADSLRSFLATPIRSTVAVQGASPRTVSDTRHTLAEGVPLTLAAIGGPSGALITRVTVRTTLQRRGDRVRVTSRDAASRLMTVRPDGTSSVGPFPRVTMSRAALRRVARRYAAARPALPFTPLFDRADGSWLGVAGDPTLHLEGDDDPTGGSSANEADSVVLATLDASGAARAVRVGTREATAETLLRSVPGAGPVGLTDELEVLGYERATRTAVVRVRWQVRTARRQVTGSFRSTVLRVPLDGTGRPTVLTGGVQAAW